jgi:hypothetical protein
MSTSDRKRLRYERGTALGEIERERRKLNREIAKIEMIR